MIGKMLQPIKLPADIMERSIPAEVAGWIRETRLRIQTFQDRWDRPQIEQFVASDYEYVYQAMSWLVEEGLVSGNRFLEWGCGFALNCVIAAHLGMDAIGIEAEDELIREGRQTLELTGQLAELCWGNFLPRGAEDLAHDPTLPSLGHPVPSVYRELGLDIDDFSMIFAYPWPGEEDFLLEVFEDNAGNGALFVQFCGPYDLRIWRRIAKQLSWQR